MLWVTLVTVGSCVISFQKLGWSQEVCYGIILDQEQTDCRSSSSAAHWMGCDGGKVTWAGEDAEKDACRGPIIWLDMMFLVSKCQNINSLCFDFAVSVCFRWGVSQQSYIGESIA